GKPNRRRAAVWRSARACRRAPGRRSAGPPRPAVPQDSFEVVPQGLRTTRMTQLRHRLGLDLADALARHPESVTDLVERLGLAVAETEAHTDDTRLPLGERIQQLLELALEHREAHGIGGHDRFGVLDQVAELAVAVLAEGCVQRDRLA